MSLEILTYIFAHRRDQPPWHPDQKILTYREDWGRKNETNTVAAAFGEHKRRRPSWEAGDRKISRQQWHNVRAAAGTAPELNPQGSLEGFTFYDGQIDDQRLALWVAKRANDHGAKLRCGEEVRAVA